MENRYVVIATEIGGVYPPEAGKGVPLARPYIVRVRGFGEVRKDGFYRTPGQCRTIERRRSPDFNVVGAPRREARPGRRFSLLPIEKNELLHIPATALIHLITDKLPVGEQFQKEIQSAHHPGFRQTAGNLLPGIATPLSSFP